ncbi:Prefoldin subunit beta [Candidatus Norongarragalina meridionalis]|nr:Prefoldin subunit beta [Candidatus Norongarragalina meridionalis]
MRDFQTVQQQLQLVLMQKQQTDLQLAELKKAEEEVSKGEGSFYRFVGAVIVPKKKEDLKKELAEEKESLELRQGIFEKQEKVLRERFDALRKKLESSEDAS